MKVKSESEVTQSCLTLYDPVDCSPPSSSVHGLFQAGILEWVAISFSRGSSQPRDWTQVSRIAGRRFNLWATREAHMISITTTQLYWCSIKGVMLLFSCLILSDSFATPWTVALQSPLSVGFPRQEYWSGLSFPSPGDLPYPYPSLPFKPTGKPKNWTHKQCINKWT